MLWTSTVVVLTLLVAGLTCLLVRGARTSRRCFDALPGSFPCRLRVVSGFVPGLPHAWTGSSGSAAWVHDALVLWIGRVTTTHVLPVRFPEGAIEPVTSSRVSGLGSAPSTLLLRLDGGSVVEIATAVTHRDLLAGPFLAACLTRSG